MFSHHYSDIAWEAWHHQLLDCLFNSLFMLASRNTSKLHIAGSLEGEPTVTVGFPAPSFVFNYLDKVMSNVLRSWISNYILRILLSTCMYSNGLFGVYVPEYNFVKLFISALLNLRLHPYRGLIYCVNIMVDYTVHKPRHTIEGYVMFLFVAWIFALYKDDV